MRFRISGARKALTRASNTVRQSWEAESAGPPSSSVGSPAAAAVRVDGGRGRGVVGVGPAPEPGSGTCRRRPRSWSGAVLVNASASTNMGTDTSPLPRILTGTRSLVMSPAARRISGFTVYGERSVSGSPRRPASAYAEMRPMFTTWYSMRRDGLEATQLGHPDVDGGLATLEPRRDRRARPGTSGPWCLDPRSCPCRRRCRGRRGCVGGSIPRLASRSWSFTACPPGHRRRCRTRPCPGSPRRSPGSARCAPCPG